jgi:DNA transformation protein
MDYHESMPVTPDKVKELLAPLEAVRTIASKKMFGGIGIYSDGVFFAVIDDDRLFFKADDVNGPDYDEHDADQWVIAGEPPSPMPYREVPSAILADSKEIATWIDAAVEVALRKKKPAKKK